MAIVTSGVIRFFCLTWQEPGGASRRSDPPSPVSCSRPSLAGAAARRAGVTSCRANRRQPVPRTTTSRSILPVMARPRSGRDDPDNVIPWIASRSSDARDDEITTFLRQCGFFSGRPSAPYGAEELEQHDPARFVGPAAFGRVTATSDRLRAVGAQPRRVVAKLFYEFDHGGGGPRGQRAALSRGQWPSNQAAYAPDLSWWSGRLSGGA